MSNNNTYDLKILQTYVDKGLLKKVEHPYLPLVLFNYTQDCAYEKAWDPITLACRGLILHEETGEVVASCIPKFFNLSETDDTRYENLPKEPYTVWDKLDGSMGTVFHYDGKWRIATRGSFLSEQAAYAEQNLLPEYAMKINTKYTLITEIIYPSNKIVVDYKGGKELVLLAVFDIITGKEITGADLHIISYFSGIGLAVQHECSIEDAISLKTTMPKDQEGFVVRFESGLRVKIKGDAYSKIHKLISDLSYLSLWEAMKGGKVDSTVLAQLPEEYRGEWEPMAKELEAAYSWVHEEIRKDAKHLYYVLNLGQEPYFTDEAKRSVGIYVKKNPNILNHPKAVFPFQMAQEELYIMKCIRPKGNKLGS